MEHDTPEISEPMLESPKPKSSFMKKFVIFILCITALGIAVGMMVTPILIFFSYQSSNEHFTKLENMMRAANPQLAALEPVNIVLPSNAPVLGSKDAPVTVVEYADFQCPFCKQFQDSIFSEFKTKFIDTGKVKFYFQNFAFLGPESQSAAEAAKCAFDQNKFWEYHDTLYAKQGDENSGAFSDDNLKKFAAGLGLDTDKFNSCVDSHIYKTDVEAETRAGQNYNVTATPSIFINGKRSEGVGKISDYEAAINNAK